MRLGFFQVGTAQSYLTVHSTILGREMCWSLSNNEKRALRPSLLGTILCELLNSNVLWEHLVFRSAGDFGCSCNDR